MSRLRHRVQALERRLASRADLDLTAEEAAALASDEPCWPLGSVAMRKMVARYGLERLVLASYEPRP